MSSDIDTTPPTPILGDGRRGGMHVWQWITLLVVIPMILLSAFLIGRAGQDGAADDRGLQIGAVDDVGVYDWNFEIPNGTAARQRAGELVEIVPAELVVHVGDTIRIINNDVENHIVGVFFVGAGEILTQQFRSAGELTGDCTVHPSGSFTLRVEP